VRKEETCSFNKRKHMVHGGGGGVDDEEVCVMLLPGDEELWKNLIQHRCCHVGRE
jgi:hypothetical protein